LHKSTVFFVFLHFLILSCFFGFREIVPFTDSYYYVQFFSEISSIKDLFYGVTSWKKDYVFFSISLFSAHLVPIFGDKAHIFLVSFISIGILLLTIYKFYKDDPVRLTTHLIFVLVSTSFIALYGNLIRQGLAISILLLSIFYYSRRKNLLSIIYFLIAYYCHKSCIIFAAFPFILLVEKKIKKMYLAESIFIILLIIYAIGNISYSLIPEVGFISDKVAIYSGAISSSFNIKLISIVLIIFVTFLLRKSPLDFLFYKFLIYVGILALIASPYELIANRILFYSFLPMPFLMTRIFYFFKQNQFSNFMLLVTTFIFFSFVIRYSTSFINIGY